MGNYSSGDITPLPTGVDDLEHVYDGTDITAVGSNDNSTYVEQTASGEYAVHMFKDTVTGSSVDLTWSGKSDLAPSESTVILQIYNVNSALWEDAPGPTSLNNTAAAGADFDLTSTISDTTNYLSGGVMTCRVYQNYQGEVKTNPGLLYGDELLVNGGFESGDPPDNWTVLTGEECTPSRVSDPHSGTYGLRLVRIDVTTFSVYQDATTTHGMRELEFCGKKDNVSLLYYAGSLYSGATAINHMGTAQATSYTKYNVSAAYNSTAIRAKLNGYKTTGTDGVFFDDVSMKRITNVSQHWDYVDTTVDGTFSVNLSPAGFDCCGMALRMDSKTNPKYFVQISLFHRLGTYRLQIWKIVNDVWTTSGSAIVLPETVVANKKLQVVVSGTSYAVTYGSTAVAGGPWTIDDAGINSNTICAKFASSLTAKVDNFHYPTP